MSSFKRITKHPLTGDFEQSDWLDDYYGKHEYGVRFPDGDTFKESEYKWEFQENADVEESI